MRLDADSEDIVLLNERGEQVGTAPKLASHHEATPLYRDREEHLGASPPG